MGSTLEEHEKQPHFPFPWKWATALSFSVYALWKFSDPTLGSPSFLTSSQNITSWSPLIDGRVRIPQGPHTEMFNRHLVPDVEYTKVYDRNKNFLSFFNATSDDYTQWAEDALRYRAAWLARVQDFRKILSQEKLNNVDDIDGLSSAPYRNELTRARKDDNTFVREQPKLPFVLSDDVPETTRNASLNFFEDCLNDATRCGAEGYQTPLISDLSLVLPLNSERFNGSWPTWESIRQLTVFPKEIILIVSGVGTTSANKVELFSYINIVREQYANFLPNEVDIQMWMSTRLNKPGEVRWFGFNQTTTDAVFTFDADDYLHPQAFHVLQNVFKTHPELDYALIQYEVGAIEGYPYIGDMFYNPILRHLRLRHYEPGDIKRISDFGEAEYNVRRKGVPSWGQWWYGNTDVEPNWGGEVRRWWDPECHNGWTIQRRRVMDHLPPPVRLFGGEDAIQNFRVIKAGFNYKCLPAQLGVYIKCFCDVRNVPLLTADEYKHEPKHAVSSAGDSKDNGATAGLRKIITDLNTRENTDTVKKEDILTALMKLTSSEVPTP